MITTGDILTSASILVGAFMVVLQLHFQHHWNRRKSTEEICNRFIEPDLYKHWNLIQLSVVDNRMKWEELSDEEKQSVRILLSFFETIGILVRRNVVDRVIIHDLFGGVVVLLYQCSLEFLPRLREQRKRDDIYCEFEQLAKSVIDAESRIARK